MAQIPTIKIKSKDTALGYVIINEKDFDPKTQNVFREKLPVLDHETDEVFSAPTRGRPKKAKEVKEND